MTLLLGSHELRAGGVGVFVHDSAPGRDDLPVVLAVHGIPERGDVWLPAAQRLAGRARVIAPDLPGFGRSERPREFDYAIGSLAAVLGDVVDALLPGRELHLAVHDLGGPIGLLWALGAHSRVASLLISGTTVFPRHFSPPAAAVLGALPLIGPRLLEQGLGRERQVRRALLRGAQRPLAPAAVEGLLAPLRDPAGRHAVAAVWGAYRRGLPHVARVREALPRFAVPASVLFGAHDPYCPPANAHAFAAAIPGARMRLLTDCGHFVPLEAPDEVAAELDWLITGGRA